MKCNTYDKQKSFGNGILFGESPPLPWDHYGDNIDRDPHFVGGGDYHLQSSSPCIDTGANSAPHLPSSDIDGDPRIVDGDSDGTSIVDIGADEYVFTLICGFQHSGSWTGHGHGADGWYVGDFNGDEKDDIFSYLPGTSGAYVFLSDGTRFFRDGSWTGHGHGSDGWYVGDFDGVGGKDIFRYLPRVSGADVFLAFCSATSTIAFATDESILAIDDDMMLDIYGLRVNFPHFSGHTEKVDIRSNLEVCYERKGRS